MKKTILFISIIFLLSALVILSLIHFTYGPNKKPNGFLRSFLKNPLVQIASADTHVDCTAIAGATDSHIYFSIARNPDSILIENYILNKKIFEPVSHYDNDHLKGLFFISIDSPAISIFAPNIHAIIVSDLLFHRDSLISLPVAFIRGVRITKHSYIIRAQNPLRNDFIFKKVNAGQDLLFGDEKNVSEKKHDGGFANDGLLYFDQRSNLLCYTFFYKNGFLCLDTNLRLISRPKTIDTFYTPQDPGAGNESRNNISYAVSKPLFVMNYEGSVSDSCLFIRSMVQADNEDEAAFKNNIDIDIYHVPDGKYRGSIHLPLLKNKRIIKFYIHKNKLILLEDSSIFIYILNFV